MSIQKKSLISALKTTKKANVASNAPSETVETPEVKGTTQTSMVGVNRGYAKAHLKGYAKGNMKGSPKGFTKGSPKGFTKGSPKGFTKSGKIV
jgi:hypothetical protein